MSAKSDYLETALFNHVLRNIAMVSPTTVYAALFTVAPTDAGGGTEVAGNAYVREPITFGAPVAGPSGTCSNSVAVNFPTASGGNWGTIVAMGIFDALTNGNLLYYGNLASNKTVSNGDQLSFAIAALTVTES
jgi:hypothetical protein